MKLFKLLGLATILAGSVLAMPRPALAQDADADSIVVLAKHTDPKPNDPVAVKFEKFKVTKATFDPKKIEGGKATIEIDATSLKTDDESATLTSRRPTSSTSRSSRPSRSTSTRSRRRRTSPIPPRPPSSSAMSPRSIR